MIAGAAVEVVHGVGVTMMGTFVEVVHGVEVEEEVLATGAT